MALDPPPGNASRAAALAAAVVPLEDVIVTDTVLRRRSRAPDFEAENRALVALMEATAAAHGVSGADTVLQKLAETTLELCRAGSAGVSVLETDGNQHVFRWRAAAGVWSRFLGESMPRGASPSGAVLDRNAPMFMQYPERHFVYEGEAPPLAEVLLIPFHDKAVAVGTLWIIAHDPQQRFDAEDLRLMTNLSRFAALAYQMLAAQGVESELAVQRLHDAALRADNDALRRTQAALRDTQDRLEAELADSRLLQTLSAELITQDDVGALYDKLLDAVSTVMHSDFASVQMLHAGDNDEAQLTLLAARNFPPEASRLWQSVRFTSTTVCGMALRRGERVITPDLEQCAELEGTADLAMFRRSGIRSCQSTPLLSRSGRLVGMISSHWRVPHVPAERELRLLDILARQAADLVERRQAEDRLREADRRKDEFLATLSHELRNPLAPVRNAVQVLRMKGPATPELQWAREVIDRQVQQMSRLIDDLLDVARITRDRLELRREHVDLATVVGTAVETSRPYIEQRKQQLTVSLPEAPVTVDADATRLAQVLANLLHNAAKFSEPGGSIELTARREGSDVRLVVRDQGIGIAPDMLEQVFELFRQVHPSQEGSRGGLGIGLTLVKRLVEMHGGSVTAASRGLGHGTEILVRLPAVDAVATVRESRTPLAAASGRRRVLVVDDHPDNADTLARLLELLGYDARTAHDGATGLALAAEFRPDIALLDIGMEGMSGHELARRLRAEAWCRDTMLIAVSGWGQVEDKRRTADAGFDHHLVKPVDPSTLAALLATLNAPTLRAG